MFKNLLIAIVIIVFASVSAVSAQEVGKEGCYVASKTGGSINVRFENNTNSPVVAVMTVTQEVPVVFEEGGWYRVYTQNGLGWVSASVAQLTGDCSELSGSPSEKTIYVVRSMSVNFATSSNQRFVVYSPVIIFCQTAQDCAAAEESWLYEYDFISLNAIIEPYCPPSHEIELDSGDVIFFYEESRCQQWQDGSIVRVIFHKWFPPDFEENYYCFSFIDLNKSWIEQVDGTYILSEYTHTTTALDVCSDGQHQFDPFPATWQIPANQITIISLPHVLSEILMSYLK